MTRQCRLSGLILSGLVVLAACAGGPGDSGEDDAPFRGGVAADEPRAAQVARDVLARGGSAADAAVALYFTLSVTRPSHAGLGAAGTCLAWDPRDEAVRAFNFKQPPSASGRPEVAQPGAPRAMQALHGLHGRQRWGQLVAPAEALARFGHRVSRTFATDLAEADPQMLASDGMRRLFVTETGRVAGEGDEIRQPELAATLGIIRTEGTTALHAGPLADRLVEGVAGFGGQLDRRDLAAFTPRVSEPLVRRISSTRVAFAPWVDTQGPYQALLWDALADRSRFRGAREENRTHLVAEAAGRAREAFAATAGSADAGGVWASDGQADALMSGYAADRHTAPAAAAAAGRRANAAGTSFVVVDDRGAAVACGLTMGRPFGAGRVAGDTGIIPAVRSDATIDDDSLSPIIAMNPNSNVLFFAGAGSGPGAATAVTTVVMRTLEGVQVLQDAMDAPRAEHRGAPDVTFVEPAAPDAVREDLAARGHIVQRLPSPSLVNAAFCSGGMPRNPESCRIGTDRRGFGLDAFVRR